MTSDADSPSAPTPYDLIGGEAPLRAVIEDFVARVTSDVMIGFFFRKIDQARLAALEFEFAAAHLGGPQRYTGRPLQQAHGGHPIMGGQFNRRLRLLDQTLIDHGVPDEVRLGWLAHNERLRSHITRDNKAECNDPLAPKT